MNVENLISYFEIRERDEKVGISIDGFEKLLIELNETLPELNKQIKDAFEIQDEFVLKSSLLLDYNIKPRDILDLISIRQIVAFCKELVAKLWKKDVDAFGYNYKD